MPLLIVTSSRVAVILLQLIYIKIYTNILSTYELGQYAFWLTTSYFFNALIFVPIDNFVQSRLHEWKERGVSLKGAVELNITLLIICISFIATFGAITAIAYSFIAGMTLSIALTYGLVLHISNISRNLTNNLNYRELASIFLIIDGIAKILAILIMKHITSIDSVMLIASATVSTLFSSAFCIFMMKYRGVFFEGNMEKIKIKEAFSFGYPISISAILNWLQLQGYRLVLVPMGYSEAVGIYSTISSIGSAAMNAVGSIYSQLKIPGIYKSKGHTIKSYFKWAIIIIIGVTLSLWLISHLIIELLTKSELVAHSGLIVFGVLVEGGNIILGAFGIAHSLNRPTHVLITVGFAGFASSVLGFIGLLGYIDAQSIGYPLVLSQLVAILYILFAVNKSGWLHQKIGD
jgi:O-antigen/teichoic acid export membrane protein